MSDLNDKLEYLEDTKTAIKNAIVEKGVAVADSDTFRSYAEKISSITGGGSGGSEDWQPNPNWWDIKTILQEDTRNEINGRSILHKFIELRLNSEDTTEFNLSNNDYDGSTYAVYTSDGVLYTYTDNGANITHTWDKSKDKPVSNDENEHQKTRYVIYYLCNNSSSKKFSTSDLAEVIPNRDRYNYPVLYVIFKLNIEHGNSGTNDYFYNFTNLQSFDFLDGYELTFYNAGDFCHGCLSLVKLPDDKMSLSRYFAGNFSYFCCGCRSLTYLPDLNYSKGKLFDGFCSDSGITNFSETLVMGTNAGGNSIFADNSTVYEYTKCKYFNNVIDISTMTENPFARSSAIVYANFILPKISINLSYFPNLLKDSIKFLADNAPDVTQEATKPTLTLGATLIARAGGQDGEIISTLITKGWNVN